MSERPTPQPTHRDAPPPPPPPAAKPGGGRDRRGLLASLVAVGLLAAAGIVLVAAFAAGGSAEPEGQRVEARITQPGARPSRDPVAAPSTAAGAEGAVTVNVGTENCDDDRALEEARNAQTPVCTVPTAIDLAPAGSVVALAPGTYPKLRLEGRSSVPRSLTITSQDPKARAELDGASLQRVGGITLENLLMTGTVSMKSAADMRIVDNGFDGHGIYVGQSKRVQVIGNRVRDVRGVERSFLAQGSPDPAKANQDLLVRGNLFDGVQHDAIAIYNGYQRAVVERNVVANVKQPRNFQYHSDAMQFMGGEGLTLRDNVVRNVSHGILFKDGPPSKGLVVEGNLITGTLGAGLQIFNAPGVRVANNTVWKTRYGTIVGDKRGVTTLAMRDNVFDTFKQLYPGAVKQANANVFGRGKGVGKRAHLGAPRFVNLRRGDFRIVARDPGFELPRGREVPGAQLRLR